MSTKQLWHYWISCLAAIIFFAPCISSLERQLNDTFGSKIVEIKCTENCICDHFRDLRRASCINKKMLYVKENIPRRTQILEFSYNYLTKIHTDEFHNNELEDLKVLNVSHNRISDIDIFAFEPIEDLEILDLSYNALQYVLPEWFWKFASLKEVYLSHNNLGSLKDVPLFACNTLRILDLSNCQLPHLYDSTLVGMPALEMIDVSENHLNTIRTTVIDHLQNLTEIRLQKNSIKCDNFFDFFIYLRELSINYKSDCQEDNNNLTDVENVLVNSVKREMEISKRKFEKVIDWTEHKKDDSIITSWKVEEIVKFENDETKCIQKDKDFLQNMIETHAYITISVCICFGFCIGITFSCLFRLCKYPRRTTNVRRRNIKSMHRVSRSYSFRGGEVQDRELLI